MNNTLHSAFKTGWKLHVTSMEEQDKEVQEFEKNTERVTTRGCNGSNGLISDSVMIVMMPF
jgi:spore coat protein CotF